MDLTLVNNRAVRVNSPTQLSYVILTIIYSCVMAWVWAGIWFATGNAHIGLIFYQLTGFICATTFFYLFLFNKFHYTARTGFLPDEAAVVALILISLLAASHWAILGRIPIIVALRAETVLQVAIIRESIQHAQYPLVGYIPTLIIKSGIPFLTIYFLAHKRNTMAWVSMAIGLIYGISLLQKSFPLITLIPPAAYCALTCRPAQLISIIALAVASVMVLILVANPHLRPRVDADFKAVDTNSSLESKTTELANTAKATSTFLIGRVIFLPGKVASDWFQIFPAKFHYTDGCGYRFIAPLLNCPFVSNPIRLYPLFYPQAAASGIKGTYNAVHFAEDYANFGAKGLFLSGILAATALAAAAAFTCHGGFPVIVAVNLPGVMALSSSALHTTLITHGWIPMILLTLFFFRRKPLAA